MEDDLDSNSCQICLDAFLSDGTSSGLVDRRPAIICSNGHSACMTCAGQLLDHEQPKCPSCRGDLLAQPILNRPLMSVVDAFIKRINHVPEISIADLQVAKTPFASGAFADVYHAKWHTQDVVIKSIRPLPEITEQMALMHLEAHLAIGLFHPNIIRIFGTTTFSDKRFGIVMEKADNGSLDKHLWTLEQQCAVRICMGVVDGLDYVHSRRVAHRDLKPQNILMSGPEMTPKLADFGVSKVIQTLVTNSAMIGTPKYAAPEMLEPGTAYGVSVDTFSLTIIMFEAFSGVHAETGLGTSAMQIMLSVVKGRRPKIPAEFPASLKPLIVRGWDVDPQKRPPLSEFRVALRAMVTTESMRMTKRQETAQTDNRVSMIQQASEVKKVNLPMPMISLKWNTSSEVLNSRDFRAKMVEEIRTKSNMSRIINEAVLTALGVTPRHLFIYEERLPSFVGKKQITQQESVNAAYLYNRPMPGTLSSNESSPEIIGTQLSLTEIIPGQAVLLVGIKGGYIQSLVAQLVSIHGSVVTATSDAPALNLCRDRVNAHCPLKNVVRWLKVDNVTNVQTIVSAVRREKLLFHTIVYCGSVDRFPDELVDILHPAGDAAIMVPVENSFQLWQRRNGAREMRTITDFGVRFEGVR